MIGPMGSERVGDVSNVVFTNGAIARDNGDVFIYQNDKIILEKRSQRITINNSGQMYLGKSSVSGNRFFNGDIHELRIWSKLWSIG